MQFCLSSSGTPLTTRKYTITSTRTGRKALAEFCLSRNGGSQGDGHGRWASGALPGDWRTGDGFLFDGSVPGHVIVGDRFIQVGDYWRMGESDGDHFSISHQSGKTAVIYRSDGTVHRGPRTDHGVWARPLVDSGADLSARSQVTAGDRYIQIGQWRLGDRDGDGRYLEVTHRSGKTAAMFKSDGTSQDGPIQHSKGVGVWARPNPPAHQNVDIGDRLIAIGSFWRMGEHNNVRFSVSHSSGRTPHIFDTVGPCAGGSSGSCQAFALAGTSRSSGYSGGGTLVKVTGGKRICGARDQNSCPTGFKIFAPQSKEDWQKACSFLPSPCTGTIAVDVTKSSNGGDGKKCTVCPTMNSRRAGDWKTSDGAPWWLRDSPYSEPNGDYTANCFLSVTVNANNLNGITFNDRSCIYCFTTYFCSAAKCENCGMWASGRHIRGYNLREAGFDFGPLPLGTSALTNDGGTGTPSKGRAPLRLEECSARVSKDTTCGTTFSFNAVRGRCNCQPKGRVCTPRSTGTSEPEGNIVGVYQLVSRPSQQEIVRWWTETTAHVTGVGRATAAPLFFQQLFGLS